MMIMFKRMLEYVVAMITHFVSRAFPFQREFVMDMSLVCQHLNGVETKDDGCALVLRTKDTSVIAETFLVHNRGPMFTHSVACIIFGMLSMLIILICIDSFLAFMAWAHARIQDIKRFLGGVIVIAALMYFSAVYTSSSGV